MTLSDLAATFALPQVAAFLRVIREGESGQTDAAYSMRWPGKTFSGFADHPRAFEPAPGGTRSSAAGAYQITATTWDDLRRTYPFPDFSPRSQDLACVALLYRRNAVAPLLAGGLETAIARCRTEWTSLPGASQSGRVTMERARQVFQQYGGHLAAPSDTQPSAPIVEADPAHRIVNNQEAPVLPAIIPALLPSIVQMIPAIAQIFGSGSEVSQRNAKAAQVVADTVVAATNSVNLQEAAEKMKADDSARQAAQIAVLAQPDIASLLEVGGGIEAARKAAADPAQIVFWRNPAVLVTAALAPLLYIVVVRVMLYPAEWSETLRAVVVTAIVSGLLGSITGFFLGSSLGSQRKDAVIATK